MHELQCGPGASQNHLSDLFRPREVYAGMDSGIGSSYQKGGGAAVGSTELTG